MFSADVKLIKPQPDIFELLQSRYTLAPARTVFIDDLPPHHSSAKALVPDVHRLHMVAEAPLRGLIPHADDAHARIDEWPAALAHIENILAGATT
jgi:FMN phosphatase YigB (HAD superfamily)